MVTASARSALALAVGAIVTMGVVAGCTTPHTQDGFVEEMRSSMSDAESGGITDDQILAAGRIMCSFPGALDSARAEHADKVAVVESYCDVLRSEVPAADPMAWAPETEAASAAIPAAEMPIVVGTPFGINYGGTENAMDVNITGVTRCGTNLVLSVRLVTGSIYSEYDTWNDGSGVEYIDTTGVTRTANEAFDSNCVDYDEDLPYAHERKPSRTYEGKVLLDVPAGKTTALQFSGSDGVTRTLDVAGV
ncbi:MULTISPECIES: hypothetical protein [unclassified Pseudonocardia]|uniref:hypothetical protein n=1 Tax=unclassified Pseudonocardia TaxID=2619320 RepID=UPI0001FFF361|nr:hypothetical protein [Pseudonocardia sp. Ae707_Ps1]OLM17403.1 hypothetical protein Ae707Ps1_1662c [Pseudonocardia sp. Ae707_Ps1]